MPLSGLVSPPLHHVAHTCMQLPNVCAARLARGQRHLGPWPGCTRSLIIWRWPRDPANVHQLLLDGIRCALHQAIGSEWQSARVMQFIMSDEPLLAADASQDPDGVVTSGFAVVQGSDGEVTDGGSPSGLSATQPRGHPEFFPEFFSDFFPDSSSGVLI